jgi:hypothetical protein
VGRLAGKAGAQGRGDVQVPSVPGAVPGMDAADRFLGQTERQRLPPEMQSVSRQRTVALGLGATLLATAFGWAAWRISTPASVVVWALLAFSWSQAVEALALNRPASRRRAARTRVTRMALRMGLSILGAWLLFRAAFAIRYGVPGNVGALENLGTLLIAGTWLLMAVEYRLSWFRGTPSEHDLPPPEGGGRPPVRRQGHDPLEGPR